MDKMNAIILVGGKGSRLLGLTKNKTKSYVSFMGKYRIIDFPLSSLSFSHVYDVGILTQYEPYDLMKYIGSGSSWDLDISNRGISFLTPYETGQDALVFQKGTANAVLSQIEYIKKSSSDYILILPGDQIYKIDFREVLKEHILHHAELTILSTDVDPEKEDLSRFGIIEYDTNKKILSFEEKPKHPKSNHVSMGIYLFNKETILKYLPEADKMFDFGNDLIPYIIKNSDNVYAYNFNDLFMDVGTVKSLYDANMYFLDHPELSGKPTDPIRIYSKPFDYEPHIIRQGGSVKKCIVSDGSDISGTICHSVISFKVIVREKAEISDSVILPGAVIGKNAKISHCIIDEGMIIKDNSVLLFNLPTLIDQETYKDGAFNG